MPPQGSSSRQQEPAVRRPPLGPRSAGSSGTDGGSLQVVGSSVEPNANSTAAGPRSTLSRNSSRNSSGAHAGPTKPADVYAAAVAEMQDADSKSLTKLQQLRTQAPSPTPSSPIRKRSASAYAPGALPALPPSPNAASLLNRTSRLSDANTSILDRRADDAQLIGTGRDAAGPYSPSGRRTASAPDSQSALLINQHNHHTNIPTPPGADPWRAIIHEGTPVLRTGPGIASLRTNPTDTALPHQSPSRIPNKPTTDTSPRNDAPSAIAYVYASPTQPSTPPRMAATGLSGLVTVFGSPRSGDSTPGAVTPSTNPLQRKITSPLYSNTTQTSSPGGYPVLPFRPGGSQSGAGADGTSSTQPSTPTTAAYVGSGAPGSAGGLWPRPPEEGVMGTRVASPPVRTRRRSLMMTEPGRGSPQPPERGSLSGVPDLGGSLIQTLSGTCSANGAPDSGSHIIGTNSGTSPLQPGMQHSYSMGGIQHAHSFGGIQHAHSVGGNGSNGGSGVLLPTGFGSSGRFEGLGGNSPAQTPNSRPNSGRGRAVQVLMDAVRSRDESRFRDAMDYLKLPHGGVAGINDRHTVTGRTPLHEAVMLNNLAMVRALLNAGADPHLGHMSQGPPLLHAAAWGESAMLALLLEGGADISARDIAGYTALHYACAGGHADAGRILLDHGADASAVTHDNDTPAMLAISHHALLHQLFGLTPEDIQRHQDAISGGGGGGVGGGMTGEASCYDITLGGRDSEQLVTQIQGAEGVLLAALQAPQPGLQQQQGQQGPGHQSYSSGGGGGGGGGVSGSGPSPPQLRQHIPAPPGGVASKSFRLRSLALEAAISESPPTNSPSPANQAPISHTNTSNLTSPMSDGEDRAPPPAPELELPRSVRRQLSKGANLQDIIHAFEDEDEEIVRRHSNTGEGPLLAPSARHPSGPTTHTSSSGGTLQPTLSGPSLLAAFHDRSGTPTSSTINNQRPTSSKATSNGGPGPGSDSLSASGTPNGTSTASSTRRTAAPVPPLQLSIPRQNSITQNTPASAAASPGLPVSRNNSGSNGNSNLGAGSMAAMLMQRQGSFSQAGNGGPNSAASSPRGPLTGLAAAVPTTPRFRFGVDIHRNPPMGSPKQTDTSPQQQYQAQQQSSPLQQQQAAGPHRSLSAPGAPEHMLIQNPAGVFNHGETVPVASASTPRNKIEAEVMPSGSSMAFSPLSLPSTTTSDTLELGRELTFHDGRGSMSSQQGCGAGGGGQARRVSSTNGGETSGDITPPLVADHSPPSSPLNASLQRKRAAANANPHPNAVPATHESPTKHAMAASHTGLRPDPQETPTLPESQWHTRHSHGNTAGGRGTPSMLAVDGMHDADRVSQAAQALLAQAKGRSANTSHEALQLRAMQMFTRSVELQTGGIQWTRGELLGEGSYGRVYAGLNQQTGGLMAVKVLELLVRNNGMRDAVTAQLKELTQELELYKKLSHKHVVGYVDHHFDPRAYTLYIFLEYVPGGSIASMLERFGRFSEELVRNYTRQLLLGLDYLHQQRVVHRDLKGGNVLVTRDGVIKLADFGASKAFNSDTITEGMKSIKGSVFWMAPEVIKRIGYNQKADIWSLGCTVIEMLTGKHPWPQLDNALTAMFQIAKQQEGPPRPSFASPVARDFLDCCLRHDPQDRPSAAELLKHPFVASVTTAA